jgi:hypothetical protein
MASEDSDQIISRLPTVHRFCNACDLDETARCPMLFRRHDRHAPLEPLEVLTLRGSQRMLVEERNDRLEEIMPSPDHELDQVLTMVVVSPVWEEPTHPEELTELFKASDAARTVCHDKRVGDLVAGAIATPARPIGLFDEADREATFPIYETDHPAGSDQPFLLIVRTVQIVTVHSHIQTRTSTGQILGFSSI